MMWRVSQAGMPGTFKWSGDVRKTRQNRCQDDSTGYEVFHPTEWRGLGDCHHAGLDVSTNYLFGNPKCD